MSFEKLEAHFQENPIRYIGRGAQLRVYGTPRAAVKILDPLPGYPVRMEAVYRKNLPEAKAGMGGLVLPFELPPEVKGFEIQGTRWFFFENRVPVQFSTPVVQERTSNSDRLRVRMEQASTSSEINHYADLLLGWLHVTASRGFLPHDINPSNFVVNHGDLLLQDLGAIMGTCEGRRNVLRSKTTLSTFANLYSGAYAPLLQDKAAAATFRAKLQRFYETIPLKIAKVPNDSRPVADLVL